MTIQSLDRAIDILSLFSIGRPYLGITDISKRLGLSKTTVHGLVQALTQRGFLNQDPETRKYGLGLKIHELGIILAGSLKINTMGSEAAHRLAGSTGWPARLAIWDNDSVLSSFNHFPNTQPFQSYQLAPRFPAHCTGIGKAVLAWFSEEELGGFLERTPLAAYTPNTITDKNLLIEELEKVRRQGYAMDAEEYMIGICCMGTAIFDHTKRPIGGISISWVGDQQVVMGDETKSKNFTGELIRTAMEISRKLGYLPEMAASMPNR